MAGRFSLVFFLALVLGGGLALGYLTVPGEWYAALQKPPFNPPAWVFGPAWTTLYILIAVAGWLVWRRASASLPMKLWWAQLALNFAWTPAFFGARQIGVALVIILVLLAVIFAFIATAWREHRTAALLFLPYAGWVAFASTLNAAIFVLN